MEKRQLMLGDEAVARGAYEAGVRVVSAYPGTPSTEVTECMAQYKDVYSEWAPNEKVAAEVAIGASIGGARSMCCMKHVGLNVAADPVFTAAYTGVNGGLVVVVADDPGMHSSQNEQDTRMLARAAHVPALEPADSQEAKEFTARAFELSEEYDTPVILRLTTRIAHSQSVVELGERAEIELKPYIKNPAKYVMMPGMAKKRHVVVEEREERLAEAANALPVNRVEMADTKLGVICAGAVYQYVKETLPEASVLKLGLVNPLPRKLIEDFSKKVERLVVIEELEPVFEEQIKAWGIACDGKNVFSRQGEFSSNLVAQKLTGKAVDKLEAGDLPVRPPVMCPGCPHRGTYYLLAKNKATVMGDIGCYTLGALEPLRSLDACVCMGASVGMAMGMEKALGKENSRKVVGIIGDSTFLHSGMTGLLNMVYNGGTGTIIIVDNGTTGMTGHQQHAGTGKDIRNDPAPQVNLEELVKALGVKDVRVLDPFDLKNTEKELKDALAGETLSVLIMRRPCALIIKEKFAPYQVDQTACKKCKMCLKIGCPSIEDKGENGVVINKALCFGCGLCANVCPFGAMKKEEAK